MSGRQWPRAALTVITSMVCAGAQCPQDAQEGLAAFGPGAPSVDAGSVIYTGVTDANEGRARISTSDQTIWNGVVGYRAYLSTNYGATWPDRRPFGKYSNERGFLLLDNLAPATHYGARLVAVSNMGFESATAIETWDHDNDGATPFVPIEFDTPATKTDSTPPSTPGRPTLEWHGDAVSVQWNEVTSADVYGYHVERSPDTGSGTPDLDAVVRLNSAPLLDAEFPHFRDAGAATATAFSLTGDQNDGTAAGGNGIFDDPDAVFLSDGVTSAHTLRITSGPNAGDHDIITVDSETGLTVSSLLVADGAMSYEVKRPAYYRIIAEDLSGNLSNPSTFSLPTTTP